ncbi:hypothetical protein QQ045_020640 [Rhodiola kirilowii]
MELSLIGLQNAGKTSLVNVVATGGYSEDMIPTVCCRCNSKSELRDMLSKPSLNGIPLLVLGNKIDKAQEL